MKITINSKEYDYDCLDSFAKEQRMLVFLPGIFSAKLKFECFSCWQK